MLTFTAAGIEASSTGKACFDPGDRLNDVGAGLTLDCENDRAAVVVPAGDEIVLRRADGVSDVANAHRRAVAVGDDEVVIGAGVEQLIVGVERDTSGAGC